MSKLKKGGMSPIMIALIASVGGLILVGVVLYSLFAGTYNDLVARDEAADTAWANVETVLQRRFDLIPNLVATVQGFADQEQEVLTEVTRLRSQWQAAQTPQEQVTAASGLERALGRLLIVQERYPELRSNTNFLRLQDELAGTENRIAVERRRYNEAIQAYNQRVRQFPGAFIANMTGFTERERFEAAPEAQEAPVVDFDS